MRPRVCIGRARRAVEGTERATSNSPTHSKRALTRQQPATLPASHCYERFSPSPQRNTPTPLSPCLSWRPNALRSNTPIAPPPPPSPRPPFSPVDSGPSTKRRRSSSQRESPYLTRLSQTRRGPTVLEFLCECVCVCVCVHTSLSGATTTGSTISEQRQRPPVILLSLRQPTLPCLHAHHDKFYAHPRNYHLTPSPT